MPSRTSPRRIASGALFERGRAQTETNGYWVGDDAGWLITLSDLTLLLLCFLAPLHVNDAKKKALSPQAPLAAPAIPLESPFPSVLPGGPNAEQWKELHRDIRQFVASLGMSRDITIESAPDEILLSLKDTIPFASGKAELRSAALPVLEKVATIALNQPTLNLEISGHADNRPIANEVYPSNWELSAARASRVARYLVEKGVHPSRLAVQGYASHKPRRPNSNVGDRMANRRVEIRLYYSPDAKAVEPQEGDGASR